MKNLTIVDAANRPVGFASKQAAHQVNGLLHEAYTILIFNNSGEILLQRRSKNKLLWPLFWETSCSSHPELKTNLLKHAEQRLKQELGFTCSLKKVGKFQYQARYKNIGSENEICWVLIGKYNGKIQPNPKEVSEIKWFNITAIKEELKKKNGKYVPWLKPALQFLHNV